MIADKNAMLPIIFLRFEDEFNDKTTIQYNFKA